MLIALINKINLSFWDLAIRTAQAGVQFESMELKITFLQKKKKKEALTDSAYNIRELEM